MASSSGAENSLLKIGLTINEAHRRLQKFGPNSVPDLAARPLRRVLTKFWAPVPWMLEASIILEIALGKYVEAAVIGALLVFNAALGFIQEGRAQATLTALKSRLAMNASVLRDSAWAHVPASALVPGDIVKLSLGAVVAADVRLMEGGILLDHSMLTGEALTRRDHRFGKRRPRHVPAYPDLYAQFRDQEDCAGALPGAGLIFGRPFAKALRCR